MLLVSDSTFFMISFMSSTLSTVSLFYSHIIIFWVMGGSGFSTIKGTGERSKGGRGESPKTHLAFCIYTDVFIQMYYQGIEQIIIDSD